LANKKGDKYKCEECGLVMVVEDPCGCEATEIVCCDQPMKPVKETKKAKPSPKKSK
jgi:Desulfoferrodoxin, N-terminal domain